MLTISGHGSENKDYETASGWIRERRCGSFTRRLPIPRGVDVDKVETKFEDGLLELRVSIRMLIFCLLAVSAITRHLFDN